MKYKKKILFNYLPPAVGNIPSPAFSVLKSYLENNGIKSEIYYWNIWIHDLLSKEWDSLKYDGRFIELDLLYLAPFLSMISDDLNCRESEKKIVSYLRSKYPQYGIDKGFYSRQLKEWKHEIFELFYSKLNILKNKNIGLIGFTSKFHQWIPGLILSRISKELFPDVKIVIGGFGDSESSKALMQIGEHFDFAIWGEGEHSLNALYDQIMSNSCNYDLIPRLVYREKDGIKSTTADSSFLNMEEYIFPEYSDYRDTLVKYFFDDNSIELPIESKRGCNWNRCKFCFFNVGQRYRVRPYESVLREIEYMNKKYMVKNFRFVDNDIVGDNISDFEVLLDEIIKLSATTKIEFQFYAEILHHNFSKILIKKIALSGFKLVQIGYEAITDSLLKKMDKKSDFSDHLLFVKFAIRYGIRISGANIIRGIVGENTDDVIESINNLSFLRFFLCLDGQRYTHNIRELRIQGGTRFLKEIKENEKKVWDLNQITYLLPKLFLKGVNRFSLFDFTRNLKNKVEWERFDLVNTHYEENEYSYKLINKNEIIHYYEYLNNRQIERIVFDIPEYWEILKIANDSVVSFEHILLELNLKYPDITEDKLAEILQKLKSSFLLYSNFDLSRNISIINTELAI